MDNHTIFTALASLNGDLAWILTLIFSLSVILSIVVASIIVYIREFTSFTLKEWIHGAIDFFKGKIVGLDEDFDITMMGYKFIDRETNVNVTVIGYDTSTHEYECISMNGKFYANIDDIIRCRRIVTEDDSKFIEHDLFCGECGRPLGWKDITSVNEGIGAYEYWGAKGVDVSPAMVSRCCLGRLYKDANLVNEYEQWELED